MNTKVIQCKKNDIIMAEKINEAAQLLRHGETVAFPTETVYGIGANALDQTAVAKIFVAKGRPSDNPLNVLVPNKTVAFSLAKNIPMYVEQLMDVFSPGPITYVLSSAGKVASNVTANLSTVGVRIPNHEITLRLLQEAGLPLAAPSANVSGKPSPTTAKHVMDDLFGKVAAIIDGGPTNVGLESTVVDCTGAIPIILRSGVITAEDIKQVTGECGVASDLQIPSNKLKHYHPEVPLVLVMDKTHVNDIINKEKAAGKRVGAMIAWTDKVQQVDKLYTLGEDGIDIAVQLYGALRSIKKTDVDIVISAPFSSPIVMDRLKGAASKIV